MFNDGIRTDANDREINKKISEKFFKNEKALRMKHGLNIREMSECIEVNQASLSQWEGGKYVPANLDEIIKRTADLFNLDPEILLSDDFADRYDPDAYKKNPPEEKPKNLTPVVEIDGKHYVNQHETDREITIRYMTTLIEEQKKKRDEMYAAYKTASIAFENYKNALAALGVYSEDENALGACTEDTTDGTY